jgi:hypothetical protein
MFISSVNDTGDKLFGGVNDTGDKFFGGVNDSDSPSAKSKGVRLVSAKQEISHTPAIGKNKFNLKKKNN